MQDITKMDERELSALFAAVSLNLARIEEDRRSTIAVLRKIHRAREARTKKTSRAGPSGPA